MPPRAAKLKAIQGLLTDTSWAIFILNPEGDSLQEWAPPEGEEKLNTADSFFNSIDTDSQQTAIDRFKQRRPDAVKQAKKLEAEAEIWNGIIDHLELNGLGKSGELAEVGAFLLPEHNGGTACTMIFVPNIAEYQAREISTKFKLPVWVSSRAFYDTGERTPFKSTDIRFFRGVDDSDKAWHKAENSAVQEYLSWLHNQPIKREPGIFILAHFSRYVVQRSRGVTRSDRLSAAVKLFKSTQALGLGGPATLAKYYDIEHPAEVMTGFTILTPEEAASCTSG